MTDENSREPLHKKVDDLRSEIKNLRGDVQSIERQLPGEEQLQTQSGCKRIKSGIDDRIDHNEARSRYRDAAIGGLALTGIAWQFWELLSHAGNEMTSAIQHLYHAV